MALVALFRPPKKFLKVIRNWKHGGREGARLHQYSVLCVFLLFQKLATATRESQHALNIKINVVQYA